MTDTDQSVPNDATNKTTDLKQPEIKPLRTMRGDIAELLAQNTLSPTELKSIQTQLQDEARAYHAQGGDERYLENLLPKQKETDINALFSSRGAIKKPESDADLFIQKTTAEIIAEQIPKARQKTEELKQAVSQTPPVPTPPVAQIKIPEAPKAPTPPVPPVVTPVKKEEPPVPIQKAPEIKIPPVDPLIAEEKELTIAFSTFPEKERVLFEAVKKLATERAGFEALLAPLLEEERVLEEKENSLHLEEARAEGVTARRHLEEERDAVRLMTVHASKGLEFAYVFVVGLEEGLFPHERDEHLSEEDAEEERRLFYVAVTRAKKKLVLSYAQTRTIFGSSSVNIPSQFVFDIPEEYIEREFLDFTPRHKPLLHIEF
jgi:hypothetical protein